ncbi:MAG TPA: hypothetical protein PLJ29_00105 [Leptospiraceae bacterium]|nr:hypothetical protein [Leptospiraceae bacterium]
MRIFNILCMILLGIPAFLFGSFWFFIYGGFTTGFEAMRNWNANRVMEITKEQENG